MKTSEIRSHALFISAHEVSELTGVSVTSAYKIIRDLNEELSKKGYLTISGKPSKKYFFEKIYGEVGKNA